jgi:hypothetical protein
MSERLSRGYYEVKDANDARVVATVKFDLQVTSMEQRRFIIEAMDDAVIEWSQKGRHVRSNSRSI